MRKSSLTVASSLLAVFVSGAVVGAFGHRLYTARTASANVDTRRPAAAAKPSPEEFRRRYTEELRTRLNLDEPQLAKLNTILDDTRERFQQMRERSKEQSKIESGKIRHDQRNHIRAMLRPEQQAEYEKIIQERENRERERQKANGHKP